MLKLGRAQGVCMAAAITNGVNITEYAPKEIKTMIGAYYNTSENVCTKESHTKIKIIGAYYKTTQNHMHQRIKTIIGAYPKTQTHWCI